MFLRDFIAPLKKKIPHTAVRVNQSAGFKIWSSVGSKIKRRERRVRCIGTPESLIQSSEVFPCLCNHAKYRSIRCQAYCNSPRYWVQVLSGSCSAQLLCRLYNKSRKRQVVVHMRKKSILTQVLVPASFQQLVSVNVERHQLDCSSSM